VKKERRLLPFFIRFTHMTFGKPWKNQPAMDACHSAAHRLFAEKYGHSYCTTHGSYRCSDSGIAIFKSFFTQTTALLVLIFTPIMLRGF